MTLRGTQGGEPTPRVRVDDTRPLCRTGRKMGRHAARGLIAPLPSWYPAQHRPRRNPPSKEDVMGPTTTEGLTRRQMLQASGTAAAAGYALSVETVLAQAIKTDTQGIVAGNQVVK